MSRVKVNRITEKGVNLPPTEYDDGQPIIKQALLWKGAQIIGLDEESRVWAYIPKWTKSEHSTLRFFTDFGEWIPFNPTE